MQKYSTAEKVFTTLRIAVACCFIGHGAFGIITKAVWCNYFAVVGIGQVRAYELMPWFGTLDIALGLTFLLYPLRIIAVWLVIWGLVTALLRPLSGEPFAECIERAGNYGVPFALLLLSGGVPSVASLFRPLSLSGGVPDARMKNVFTSLKVIAFLLLAGHGWLNLLEKKSLIAQYTAIGFSQPHQVALWAGLFELTAAVAVLFRPLRSLIVFFLIWKMGTELFYPKFEIFEWIERGGSYGALLSLWFLLGEPGVKQAAGKLFYWQKENSRAPA